MTCFSPALQLELVHQEPLEKFWDGRLLSGMCWRFYYNDAPGAGVRIGGKRIELFPDSVYILPPFLEKTETWCRGHVRQTFIHFELTHLVGNSEFSLNRLPLVPELKAPLFELKDGISGTLSAERIFFLALRLVSSGMAMLPAEAVQRLPDDLRVKKACDFLRRNLSREVSLAELASTAGFAPNAFLRRFRQVMGMPPYRYLLQMRYSRAAQLLEGTSHSIEEICDAVGIRDRFHFSRCFKRIYGLPPAEYRKGKAF